MLIYPAIDLRAGKCVRLAQGRFDAVTDYGDPFAQLRAFQTAGAEWVHIVDLDGAEAGKPAQRELIERLARETSMRIQSGGGVRSLEDAHALLEAGAARAVIGSAAVRKPGEVRDWIAALGVERVCAAFDVRETEGRFEVAVSGWKEGGGVSLEEALGFYPPGALKHVLITDISRDGVLSGPNVALIRRVTAMRPDLAVQASGGVAQLSDLAVLREASAAGAIVGRALYERKFTLEQALAG